MPLASTSKQWEPTLHQIKNHNFASYPAAETWLRETWWDEIDNSIEVVKDFRYLGAHLSTRANARSSTLMSRWDKAMQQLRRMKFCLATAEMKARAIITKTYAGDFYGIEAADATLGRINQLTAVVVVVFRSRNDNHTSDCFFRRLLDNYQKSHATKKNGLQ